MAPTPQVCGWVQRTQGQYSEDVPGWAWPAPKRQGPQQDGPGESSLASLGSATPPCTDEETEAQKGRDFPCFYSESANPQALMSYLGDLGGQVGTAGARSRVWGGSLLQGPLSLPPHITLVLALQIPCGGRGRTREPAPHLLSGAAAAGGGEQSRVESLGGGGRGLGCSWLPPGYSAFPDHRCEAGLHPLFATRDQDRSLLEPAVPLPLPRHCGPR